jgi:hypothetical protein
VHARGLGGWGLGAGDSPFLSLPFAFCDLPFDLSLKNPMAKGKDQTSKMAYSFSSFGLSFSIFAICLLRFAI